MCSVFVFVLASPSGDRFSIQLATDLVQSVWQYRQHDGMVSEAMPTCTKLVWYREFASHSDAEMEYERISALPPTWRAHLIDGENPDRRDLWTGLDAQPVIRTVEPQPLSAPDDSRYPFLRLARDKSAQLTATPAPAILIRRCAS